MYDFHFAAPHICIIRSRLNIDIRTFAHRYTFDFELGAVFYALTLRQAFHSIAKFMRETFLLVASRHFLRSCKP
jgi:hypothetical protein